MTPEGATQLVRRWVKFYTRRLPDPVAQRRAAELEADLHDQVVHDRAHGVGDLRIAASILSRTVRGLVADVLWQMQHATRGATGASGAGGNHMKGAGMKSYAQAALVTIFVFVATLALDALTNHLAEAVCHGQECGQPTVWLLKLGIYAALPQGPLIVLAALLAILAGWWRLRRRPNPSPA